MLSPSEIGALFPDDLPESSEWERRFPPRSLSEGAQVTRFCPSPTGFLHLGGVYTAMLDLAIARQSGGVYVLRIEDTDREREVAGAADQFRSALAHFGIVADESVGAGPYGPYLQSRRAPIYQSYVRQLLREDRAYLCFCTKEDLSAAAERQRKAKVPPGYYGEWARCRSLDPEQVRERLAAGNSYVVRFRSPGDRGGRVRFHDAIRGDVEMDDNHNDIVILKSSANATRLPTYHLAHVVDDHLMRTSLVIRGEEWISSVPVHLQLFRALGFAPVQYAHISLLMKQEGSTRRKLSKRRDPESRVDFYIEAGYPAPAVLHYLRGLANARLMDLPTDEALASPIRLTECGIAGPLVDLHKLDDIASNYVAQMSSPDILDQVRRWASTYDPELVSAIQLHPDVALAALDIERVGVEAPRKDLRRWSDFRSVYGYFFKALFEPVRDPSDPRFDDLSPEAVQALCQHLLHVYRHDVPADTWLAQVRTTGVANGFAGTAKEYKADPSAYAGSIKDVAQMVRVLLTGSHRSPGLHLVAEVLGEPEVRRRIGAVLGD